MNFDLSEDQEMFKATAERFAAPIDVEARRKIRELNGGYDKTRWQELAELGFLALAADEDQGGMGGSLTDLVVIAEALGQGNAVDPWLENGVLSAKILATAGASETLESVLDGSQIIATAFAEPNGRFNLTPQTTTAKKSGADYIISGEKRFVLNGMIADHFLVTCDCDGELSMFLVASDAEGLRKRGYRLTDGSMAAEIQFLNVIIPTSAKLDIDATIFTEIVSEIRLLACAEMVGLAQRLFDDTVEYVKQREQFGTAIGSFQVIQHGLVDCYAQLEQMRSMLWRTALIQRSEASTWQAQYAGAKAFIGENAHFIAKRAVQFHGGMGITDELAVGHAMKRIILLDRLFGDAATNLSEYAEAA
ncbi:MAG: acyl-CoA dehydrogenase [Parasphingorhabdus sp.]